MCYFDFYKNKIFHVYKFRENFLRGEMIHISNHAAF